MEFWSSSEKLVMAWEQFGARWRTMVDGFDAAEPWFSLGLFVVATLLMIWRLGALERKGLEGTVLGTIIMPYASGFSNLAFAFVMGRSSGNGSLVLENCLVNNVTNLTLLIGLPTLFWPLTIFPEKENGNPGRAAFKTHRLNYLSLLLTVLAIFFFTGVLWALSRDGVLELGDGLVLVALFLFWQLFQVFDLLKHNIHRGRTLKWSIAWDICLVVAGGWCVYHAIDGLVAWMPRNGTGWLVFRNLGWLSGLLMVLPNGFLALYYASARRADIVYSSQIGDGHICIPMCIGLFALFSQVSIPSYFHLGVMIIIAASLVHLVFVAFWGRLPRWIGFILAVAYGYFLYEGILR